MYYTHSIEKGLSHRDFRSGFGERPLAELAELLNQWLLENKSKEDTFFLGACSAVSEYFSKHEELSIDLDNRWQLFSAQAQKAIQASGRHGGTKEVVTSELPESSFERLAVSRSSIREFDQVPIDTTLLSKAISVATHSPSACNRQAARVHVFSDEKLIAEILQLQMGLRGYSPPHTLLLVTANSSYYLEAPERNQPFIDGSLFAMTLMYSLEELGLGTCPLNTSMWPKKELALRQLLNLSDAECLVMFIAVGVKPGRSLVPYSQRETVPSITKFH